jgi:hypothetical protein
MPRYKRRDKNTDDIIDAVEKCGFEWIDLHNAGGGFPDGVAVCRFGQWWCAVPIEIKGIYGKLTKDQIAFDKKYPGLNHVCRTKEDVIALLRKYEQIFTKRQL